MNAPAQADGAPDAEPGANPGAHLGVKRIAVLAADGVEQPELETALAALKAVGAAVHLVAPRAGRIRAMHVQQPGDLLRVDRTLADARAADYDALLLPGGYIGPDLLRQSPSARALVRAFDALGKPIACMSHAALLLVSCGLAGGRRLTGWPGVRDDLVNAGAVWLDREVVRDGRYLTSRRPDDAPAFARALVPFLAGDIAGESSGDASGAAGPASDPAPEPPPESSGHALRWLGAPSLGAMLSLALLGVGVVAVNSRRHSRGGPPAAPSADRPADAPPAPDPPG